MCMHNANAFVYSTFKSGFTLKSSRICVDRFVGVVVVAAAAVFPFVCI